ncbi:MAG: Tim44/TimA family putative adaptor protein [Sneathiella sp.]|nr:Tim44/TimA family putative adaptor protein [Sneathiella sp.]
MGDGFQFLDIILLAMIAAFIFLRLRGVLGKRMGHEQPPREDASQKPLEKTKSQTKSQDGDEVADNVVAINDRIDAPRADLPFDNSPKGRALQDIHSADRNFDPDAFAGQAVQAYEAIVLAFASGDRSTLQNLLSEEVYNNFERSITDREDANQVMNTDILSVNNAEVEDATLSGSDAEITVRFETEMISQTQDEEGVVVNGDPHPHVVKELWTFARNLSSSNPNWLLITTRRVD